MSETPRSPEEIWADADAIVAWYKGLSDETKNYWAFRWLRMEDPDYKIPYETMKAAEKLWRSIRKESHGRSESV